MTKYSMIRYSVVDSDIGDVGDMAAWYPAWKVYLELFYTNWRGSVKCNRVLLACIPKDYSIDDYGKSEAVKIGVKMKRNAEYHNG